MCPVPRSLDRLVFMGHPLPPRDAAGALGYESVVWLVVPSYFSQICFIIRLCQIRLSTKLSTKQAELFCATVACSRPGSWVGGCHVAALDFI